MSALGVGSAENIESAKMEFLKCRTIPNVRDALKCHLQQERFFKNIS
jgi:hypothetical protein